MTKKTKSVLEKRTRNCESKQCLVNMIISSILSFNMIFEPESDHTSPSEGRDGVAFPNEPLTLQTNKKPGRGTLQGKREGGPLFPVIRG